MAKKRLRCRLGLHRWAVRVRENARYYACRDCGSYHETGHAIFRYPGSRP